MCARVALVELVFFLFFDFLKLNVFTILKIIAQNCEIIRPSRF